MFRIYSKKKGLPPASPFSDDFNDNKTGYMWSVEQGTPPTIVTEQNNRLEFAAGPGVNAGGVYRFKYELTGDFVVKIKTNLTQVSTLPTGNRHFCHLTVWIGGYHYSIYHGSDGSNRINLWTSNPAYQGSAWNKTVTGMGETALLQLKRAGSILYAEYDNNASSGWTAYSDVNVGTTDVNHLYFGNTGSSLASNETFIIDDFYLSYDGFNYK